MKTPFTLVLAGLFLMTLFSTCKKDNNPAPMCCPHDTTFVAMKEWVFFKEGSWWIYEEENTGEKDSVYVYESLINDDVEAFKYWSTSTWYENDFIYEHDPNWLGGRNVSDCRIRRLFRTQGSAGNFVGGGLVANFPPILGESSADLGIVAGDGGVQTISIDSTITLGAMGFSNALYYTCLLYTSPSPRDRQKSRMPSSA